MEVERLEVGLIDEALWRLSYPVVHDDRWKWATVAVLVLLEGCAHHGANLQRENFAARFDALTVPAPVPTFSCVIDGDCGQSQLCSVHRCQEVLADIGECVMMRVRFSFDSALIEPSNKTSLERSAHCLMTDRALRVSIEGSDDERGSDEQIRALGDRRKNAVSAWLVSRGTSDAQLKRVSYGEWRR